MQKFGMLMEAISYFTVCKDNFFNLPTDNCRPDYTALTISLFLIFPLGSRCCLLGAGALPEVLELVESGF